jgi:hypothetical protein
MLWGQTAVMGSVDIAKRTMAVESGKRVSTKRIGACTFGEKSEYICVGGLSSAGGRSYRRIRPPSGPGGADAVLLGVDVEEDGLVCGGGHGEDGVRA